MHCNLRSPDADKYDRMSNLGVVRHIGLYRKWIFTITRPGNKILTRILGGDNYLFRKQIFSILFVLEGENVCT